MKHHEDEVDENPVSDEHIRSGRRLLHAIPALVHAVRGGNDPHRAAMGRTTGISCAVLDAVPSSALDSFTGIGSPLLHANLKPDEHVLDLGCGAGLDSILAARQVGPKGRVYGVDLAPGMLAAAHSAVFEALLQNVTLLEAPAEQLPLPDGSVDGLLINGLFNLVPDKPVAREVARALRPGGRLLGAEIVVTDNRGSAEPDLEAWFR